VARNRKRAKERRARRPEPVISARHDREDGAPAPIAHAAPDVELAEAQLAFGRPEPADEPAPVDALEAAEEPEAVDALEAAEEPEAVDALEPGEEDVEEVEPQPLAGAGVPAVTATTPQVQSGTGKGLTVGDAAAPPARLPGIGNRLLHFLQGSWRELQRVQWPDRRQVMQATGVVVGFVIVAGVYLGVADWAATKIMNLILK